ncbi:enoyl-CoA hydratase-related protein [Futiania mangrovi]|uniref:Enoyl-CoA hydratase-related protein n=1 Tax=Futiania mangrovi TaxID=2959716 RepID=A0A9J6PIR8_9PROT|nr:enoyl-CoA hydratase-related protein [Futiania mangrovii]MCP1337704.1 enoyl-CoA hydratase-related protein [Futiania mangrovii]
MTGYSDISYATGDGVARIALARPDKLNAFRNETADQIGHALARAEDDPDVCAVILTGEGRAFGAGYDLSTLAEGTTPDLGHVLEAHFNPLVRQMRHSPLPIVAAVNGPCAGAAVGIALAADIVLAAKSAFFYEPFVGIALVPDAGNTLFLTQMMGRMRAAGMMLLGDRIGAEQACDWGLVWKVVEDAALAGEADAVAKKLATLAPHAIAGTKKLIAQAGDVGLDDALDTERDLQDAAGRTPEMQAAIKAFFAARK